MERRERLPARIHADRVLVIVRLGARQEICTVAFLASPNRRTKWQRHSRHPNRAGEPVYRARLEGRCPDLVIECSPDVGVLRRRQHVCLRTGRLSGDEQVGVLFGFKSQVNTDVET